MSHCYPGENTMQNITALSDDSLSEIDALRQKAEQDDVEAQFDLGMHYLCGLGVPEDRTEGIKWIWKAVEQGHKRARELLRQMK